MRPSFRAMFLAIPLVVLAACGGREPDRANVLFVTIDTIRADRVGAYGHPGARTPHLDRLARRGTLFAAARVPYSMTLPSHASIFTGVWPYEHGARRNDTFDFDTSLPTLPGVLGEAGWATGAVVATFALNRKFGLGSAFGSYDDLGGLEGSGAGRNERPAGEVTDTALEWLVARAAGEFEAPGGGPGANAPAAAPDAPWFLWAHYFDPHDDYEPPAPWAAAVGATDEIGRYDGEIAYTDHEVGRLLRAVEARPDAASTRLVVAGDHGEAFGEHGETGHGYFLYENSIRVPLVLGPGFGGSSGGIRADAVRSVDLFPTVAGRLGVRTPPDLPGRRLDEPGAGSPALYAETFWPALSYGATDLRVIVQGEWKYVHAPTPELYDLAVDPGETDNLALVETDVVDELRGLLEEHFAAEAAAGEGASNESEVDEATRERLLGLGYLGGGSAAEEAEGWSRRDPKDIVELLPLLFEGIRLCRGDRWEEGAPLLEQVLAMDPINPKALHWVSTDRGRRGDKEGALAVYLEALTHEPANGGLLNTIGQIHLRRGDVDEAIPVLETATEVDPRAISPYLNLVTAYGMSGRMDDARAAVRAAIAIDPQNRIARQYAKRLRVELPGERGAR